MMTRKEAHYSYCVRLSRIGRNLGYETSWENPIDRAEYYLAKPDCTWHQAINPELCGITGIPEKIPFVVFEVLFSDQEKSMRAALPTFVLRDAYRCIFVVLKDRNVTNEQYQDQISYFEKIIAKFGSNRFWIWQEGDVDRLMEKLGLKKY